MIKIKFKLLYKTALNIFKIKNKNKTLKRIIFFILFPKN